MIITARPPNFDQILAAFPDADKPGVIFAYGPDIYNPSGGDIPRALMVHESVHCSRQAEGPNLWWDKYIADHEFRYTEELFAHIAEYRHRAQHYSDRNYHAKILQETARRLTAPLYNYQPPRTMQQALRDLKETI